MVYLWCSWSMNIRKTNFFYLWYARISVKWKVKYIPAMFCYQTFLIDEFSWIQHFFVWVFKLILSIRSNGSSTEVNFCHGNCYTENLKRLTKDQNITNKTRQLQSINYSRAKVKTKKMVRDLGISQNFSFDLSPSTETDQIFRKFHGLLSLFPQMAIINFPFTQKSC